MNNGTFKLLSYFILVCSVYFTAGSIMTFHKSMKYSKFFLVFQSFTFELILDQTLIFIFRTHPQFGYDQLLILFVERIKNKKRKFTK